MLMSPKSGSLQKGGKESCPTKPELAELINRAFALGATDVAVVASDKIHVDERLARICKKPGCPFYGVSASCPPSVGGPDFFRSHVLQCRFAIVLRIDVSMDDLYSSERISIMKGLHEVVAGVELTAHSLGYIQSRAFAGGSCKELFCPMHPSCRYLTTGEGCRHPEKARPSMSGFGIDVGHLMKLANWPEKKIDSISGTKKTDSWIAGLILIG